MAKKLFLAILLFVLLPFSVCAQETQPLRFGYFSYNKVLKSMDDYAIAKHGVDDLRAQYAAEAKRSEDDFNTKYEAFLEEQAGLAANIRQKRQAELMDLMEKNQNFKTEAERLIKDAEQSSLDSLYRRINAAVRAVGQEHGYMFIINTDNHGLPYANSSYGEDVTAAIQEKLIRK